MGRSEASDSVQFRACERRYPRCRLASSAEMFHERPLPALLDWKMQFADVNNGRENNESGR